MSERYELVKYYYDSGLWRINRVQKAVEKSWITAEEYKDITGLDYA